MTSDIRTKVLSEWRGYREKAETADRAQSVADTLEKVMRQLDAGLVELHFDDKTETCNILPVEGNRPESDEDRTE